MRHRKLRIKSICQSLSKSLPKSQRKSQRKSLSKSLSQAHSPALLSRALVLLLLSSCGEERKEPGQAQGPGLDLPKGVLFLPDSEFSPHLILEPRAGQPHLLHVEVKVPEGQQLLRLRLLGPGPAFQEMGRKDTGHLDSPVIKESFEIAVVASPMQARHVLVIADYESASYAASQALPNF